MDHQRQEALRTGHSTSQQTHTTMSPVQTKDPKEERRERIESLRKERMDQLRALREKRASTAPTSQSSISQNHPNMPPIPVQAQQRPQQVRPQPRPTRQTAQQSAQQPQRRSPNPAARQIRRPTVIATSQQVEDNRRRVRQMPKPKERKAGQLETLDEASGIKAPASAHQSIHSARSMLRSRSSIRQAMVLREILDTPIALRDDDIASGSLFS